MLKANKKKLFFSSILVLLPMVAGMVLWNDLPVLMATHWGLDGNADGWSGRYFVVFGLPLFMLLLHWLCIFVTVKDNKGKKQNRKILGLVYGICPVISWFASCVIYSAAFGKAFNVMTITMLMLGLLFLVLGNYLPKCRQNRTIGIKVKWTLANEENWNVTHRFGGRVWVLGGLGLLVLALLPENWGMVGLFILMPTLIVLPILYSYLYYQRQVKKGTAPVKAEVPGGRRSKILSVTILTCVVILIVVLLVICLTGNITFVYDAESFTVEADYWQDLTVSYKSVDSLALCQIQTGARTNGFGSPRLEMGTFRNEEFGTYTRYAYTGCENVVVLNIAGEYLVLSGPDEESTGQLYRQLLEKTG